MDRKQVHGRLNLRSTCGSAPTWGAHTCFPFPGSLNQILCPFDPLPHPFRGYFVSSLSYKQRQRHLELCAQGKDVKNSWSGSLLWEESPICSRVADRLQEATNGSSLHPEVNLHTQRTRDFKHSRVDRNSRWRLLPCPTDENLKSMFGWHRPVQKTSTKGRNYGPCGRKSSDQQETVAKYELKVVDALSLSQALWSSVLFKLSWWSMVKRRDTA